MANESVIPILIPSLEPDERLTALLHDLQAAGLAPVVLIDDGSGTAYQDIFTQAQQEFGCVVLRHAANLGKGRALKDAFNYCLTTWPQLTGCITADSDGQHTAACIRKCRDALAQSPGRLVLGVRDFDAPGVPDKSRLGNKITRQICRLLCGVTVSDTQTGLRGIPAAFMRQLLSLPGERFEFETRMLLAAKENDVAFLEVPIETVYDSKEQHATHFHPLRDSWRIYRIFVGAFFRFLLSSLSSSVLDLALFSFFCVLFRGHFIGTLYAAAATAAARIISASYNYLVNYSVVFHSRGSHKSTFIRYFILACIQMACSAGLVALLLMLMPAAPELAVKIPVDVVLFFASYTIQREIVYR